MARRRRRFFWFFLLDFLLVFMGIRRTCGHAITPCDILSALLTASPRIGCWHSRGYMCLHTHSLARMGSQEGPCTFSGQRRCLSLGPANETRRHRLQFVILGRFAIVTCVARRCE